MRTARFAMLLAILACTCLLVPSCAVTAPPEPRPHAGKGPPPHAPAHGHRHKHAQDVELVFDSGLGVYVVTGHPGHYYHKDRFFRLIDGRWEISVRIGASWGSAPDATVPPKLKKKHKGKGSSKAKGPGKGKAKPKKNPGRGKGPKKK